MKRLVSVAAGLLMSLLVGTVLAGAAQAHPLGDFTVNHYNGLRIAPAHVGNLAIVDLAELPTLQAKPQVNAGYAAGRCAALAAAQQLKVAGEVVPWRVTSSELAYAPGQGGLQTSRLTCWLVAEVRPSGAVEFADGFEQDRIGWREITAVGDGVRLTRSSVPATSVSRELRAYPNDLLTDPLNQRTATMTVGSTPAPGETTDNTNTGSLGPSGLGSDGLGSGGVGSGKLGSGGLGVGGPVGDALAALDRTFMGLVGSDSLTAPLGLLAVGLAVALGAGHALIPGHGKTIMAAYLAGRRGRPRDALVVGATVTATHTVGVLVVGLLLSAFTALAGESVLAWLGVASGAMIAVIGLRLLLNARPNHSHEHEHGHGHSHKHGNLHEHENLHEHGHDHGHGHGHGNRHGHGHGHGHGRGNGRGHGRGNGNGDHWREGKRAGLVGLGVAGGLVPSPSALVVLLGAIALGRTWFGVALVTAYGVGMAATLTVTGLLLVKLVDRLDRRACAGRRLAARVSGLAPMGTAAMVVLLGAGLALRAAAAL
ncbi:High-affinity nickel-transporter [Nonomuraea purpurea]|uniref:High-affinity nickel-transporter n=1 Tax=Nonomuraea purpurea TaxID=1849276 RepID=A0ABV8GNE5_9ACTN